MNDALLRRVAALQAKSLLLHEQSEVLTELTDMQALRGFKSDLAEYISDHAQKGTLPPDPLATIRERLSPIIGNLDLIRDQKAVIEGVSKHGFSKKKIPAVSLQFMEESQLNLDECRSTLSQLQVKLFEESLAEDWDGEIGERRIHPEIQECAAVLFPDQNLKYEESALAESIRRIDELSQRIGELRELHTAQSAVADEASTLMKKQDFRSAIALLLEHKMIAGDSPGFTSAIRFKDITVPVSDLNKLALLCRDLKPLKTRGFTPRLPDLLDRMAVAQHARSSVTSPNGEFAREVTPLIAQAEEQLSAAQTQAQTQAKKRKIVGWSAAALVVAIASIVIYSTHQAGLEAEREAEQARLEAEREAERRIPRLASARNEFRAAQEKGGEVVAWGNNGQGQTTVPAGLQDVVQIAGGGYHSLALRKNGKVVAWGALLQGQTRVPAGLQDVVQIAGGMDYSLALRENGEVVAWGRNVYGQTTVPAGLQDVVQIAAGKYHSLALRENGEVVAWGNRDLSTTVPPGLQDVVQIAAGRYHSLALRENGEVVAWGYDNANQTTVPAGLEDVVQIAAGSYHSLALKEDGEVVAWGRNGYDQTRVPAGLQDVVQIAAGKRHSLALRENGEVVAWGGDFFPTAGLQDVVQIAGGDLHSLALKRKPPLPEGPDPEEGDTTEPAPEPAPVQEPAPEPTAGIEPRTVTITSLLPRSPQAPQNR